MIYISNSDTYEQRCSIIELEDSTIDQESSDQMMQKKKQKGQINSKEINRNQFIVNRIQCLQDQKKEQQSTNQQSCFFQDSQSINNHNNNNNNNNNNGYNNQSSNFILYDNTWNGKPISEYMQQENKENANNGNQSGFYFDVSQSQQIRSFQDSQDYLHTPVEKRISMKPELYLEELQNGKNIQERNERNHLGIVNEEQYYEKDPSMYTYMQNHEDNDQDNEEQYDYINEQEYERMMSEIEEKETKGRAPSNAFENYQLFKPSFHEEIIKKNAQGKKISSFSKRQEHFNEEHFHFQNQQKQLQNKEQPQDEEEIEQIQQQAAANEIDDVVIYPQNFSTFNQNCGEKRDSQNNEFYNLSNSTFNQRSVSQHQNIQNDHNNNNNNNKKNNNINIQVNNYYSNQSDNSQPDQQNQDNTFQTTLFQNSFSQIQQQSQLNNSQYNNIDKKNYDLPFQNNQLLEPNKKKIDKDQRSFENEKYIPSNLNILGTVADHSNRKENSRYPEKDLELEIEIIRHRQQLVLKEQSQQENKNNGNQSTSSGYKPTKFTQFFLGNTPSNIVSTDNTASIYSQDQQITQRNILQTDRVNLTDRTVLIERNNTNQDRYSNSQERNIQTDRYNDRNDRYNERSIQTERYNQQMSDRYSNIKDLDDLERTIKPINSRQPAQSLHQPSSIQQNLQINQLVQFNQQQSQAQQLVQKYLPQSIQSSSNSQQNQQNCSTNYIEHADNSISMMQQESKQTQNKVSLRSYIEGDSSSLIMNKSGLLPYEINNNTTNIDNTKNNISYQNINDSNINGGGGSKTYRSYFNEINERSNTFYNEKSYRNNQNEDDSINDRASQITSARPFNNNSNIKSISNNNITHQLQSTSQFQNDYSQNSPFHDHSFTDRPRYNNSHHQGQSGQNKSLLNQTDNQNDSFSKQPLYFNLNLGVYQNDNSQNKHQDSSSQEQNQKPPLFIQKQYQNIEKKLQMINQSKQASFHQSGPQKNPETQLQKQNENKQLSQAHSSSFLSKPYQPIEDRLLQKSKEREELQKQSYIQVNEAMKKHKISAKSNALASKQSDQNVSVYDRNQRFLREKEKKQLQLKEELVQQDILHPYSPHIRPQSQNLIRNVNDLIAWKENVNQKTVEMRNKQIVEEIKELESMQNEKLICKGSERILQTSSRIGNKQKIEDKLMTSGLKYQQHKDELDRIYNSNPTKNIPMINKNTFKLLLNSKKKGKADPQKQQQLKQQQLLSNKSNQSPRNIHQNHHSNNKLSQSERNESANSKYSKDHSTTNSYYSLSNATSNQVQFLKDHALQNTYSINSQNLAKVHSNNFSSQQTLSTQQSQSQTNLLSAQNLRYLQKQQQSQQQEDHDLFSDHSAEKGRVITHQKFSAVDLGNVHTVRNIAESKLKIKHILQQQQKIQQSNDVQQANKEALLKNHQTLDNLNIYDFNSPKQGILTEQNGTPRYYTNESLKKSFEMRQNYIQQQQQFNQQKSRDNSKNSHNGRGISNSSSSSCIRSNNNKATSKPKQNQLSVQERNKQWQEQKIMKHNLYAQQIRSEEAAQCPFKPQITISGQKSNGSTSRSITPTKNSNTPKDLILKSKQSYAKQFQQKAYKN